MLYLYTFKTTNITTTHVINMCKVTPEAVIRANNRLRNTNPVSSIASKEGICISVNYQGNTYGKKVSMSDIKTSFGKAMK